MTQGYLDAKVGAIAGVELLDVTGVTAFNLRLTKS